MDKKLDEIIEFTANKSGAYATWWKNNNLQSIETLPVITLEMYQTEFQKVVVNQYLSFPYSQEIEIRHEFLETGFYQKTYWYSKDSQDSEQSI